MRNKKSLRHKKKIAFVVSGGAVKAACFHMGVSLALEKKGVVLSGGTTKNPPKKSDKPTINTYVGSSAGSILASFLASGYSTRDIIHSFLQSKFAPKSLPKIGYRDLFRLTSPSISRLLKPFKAQKTGISSGGIEGFVKNYFTLGGLFTTKGIETYLKSVLPTNNFKDLTAELFIVASQLDTTDKSVFCKYERIKTRPEHHAIYDSTVKISHAAAASAALPPIYQPYQLKTKQGKIYCFDGEIRETLSTHVAKDMGCDLVIASYTHQPYHYSPEIGSLANYGISHVMIQAIYQLIEQKIHTARRMWKNKNIALDTVNEFFKDNGLNDNKRKELVDLLEKKLKFKRDVKYIFIHPRKDDHSLFLSDHFNLGNDYMIKMVQSGFRSAIYHLRNYEF
jgi:predicted acylesterase/phospholipase RssA